MFALDQGDIDIDGLIEVSFLLKIIYYKYIQGNESLYVCWP